MQNRIPTATDEECRANLRSIGDVPLDVLPDDSARAYLCLLALTGRDVYCYRAAGAHGPWNVWLISQRVPVADYAADYQKWIVRV